MAAAIVSVSTATSRSRGVVNAGPPLAHLSSSGALAERSRWSGLCPAEGTLAAVSLAPEAPVGYFEQTREDAVNFSGSTFSNFLFSPFRS